MNDPERIARFEELDAARALGDLSAEEQAEWARLVEEHGFEPDEGLDYLVAGLEATLSEQTADPRPELTRRLTASITPFMPLAAEEPRALPARVVPFWRHPALGWMAAAGLAVLLWLPREGETPGVSLAEQRQALLQSAAAVQWEFAGTADFSDLEGDVVWTDDNQNGFMRFRGLPANDPTQAQYQLWIVDPERDERPVDGGVFDIPVGGGEVVVPIRAALRVDQPVAFVITVEQPGGVVVSRQETVAAIAQRG